MKNIAFDSRYFIAIRTMYRYFDYYTISVSQINYIIHL